MATLFNDKVRCYEDGRIERLYDNWRGLNGWKEVNDTITAKGYSSMKIDGKMCFKHRIIGACFLGLNINDPLQQVDHINRIKTDNRVENLRIVTDHQNKFNKNAKGYSWCKREKKWYSQIVVNYKHISLGYYDTEAKAHQAYLDAKTLHHII